MDLLVIASESEGMPNAALEAMSCGIPILANEVCGVREVTGDGLHSWIEDLSTPQKIGETLARIAALSEDTLASAGDSCRRHAETHLSLTAMLSQYHQLYKGAYF